MTSPSVPDPRVDVLLAEIAAIRRQLDSMSEVLGVPDAQRENAAASPSFSWRVPTAESAARWAAPAPSTVSASGPAPAPQRAERPVATPVPRPQRTRPLFTPARVLAAGGAIVTILGVGFLLPVAIAAGLFGPVPRVISLIVLAGVLAFVAGRVRHRSSEASVALAATSTAAAFGAVVATTTIYDWLPPSAGVVLGMALTAAGVLVAHRWRHELLAALVHLQILVVLPMILAPLTGPARVQLVVFTVVAYMPSVWAVFADRWLRLFRFASATVLSVAVLDLVTGALVGAEGTTDLIRIVCSLVAVLIVLALAVVLDETAVATAAVVGTAVGSLVLRDRIEHLDMLRIDLAVAMSLAIVLAAVAARRTGGVRAVLVGGASVQLLLATLALPIDPQILYVLVAGEALTLLIAARRGGSRAIWWSSVAFTALALVLLASMTGPATVVSTSNATITGRWEAIVIGILVAVIGVLQVRWAAAFDTGVVAVEAREIAALAIAVHGVSSAIVTVGTLPGVSDLVAMGANVLTTLVWMGAAIAMLRHPSEIVSRVGYVVLAVAVGKLFLADLHTVDGILRAVLFVVAGLGLIVAATQLRGSAPAAPAAAPRGDDPDPEGDAPRPAEVGAGTD